MKPGRRSTLGFTLIELLVVLAILAVVSGIGAVTFVKMTDYWNDLRTRTEMDRRAEMVFQRIGEDLDGVIASSLTATPLSGTADSVTSEQFFGIPLANDTLSIPVLVPNLDGNVIPGVVTYAVEREGEEDALTRTQQIPGVKDQEPTELRLVPGVLQFRVEYTSDGKQWVSAWSDKALPRAIRVSLNLTPPGNPLREQIARVHVFPVHVQ